MPRRYYLRLWINDRLSRITARWNQWRINGR